MIKPFQNRCFCLKFLVDLRFHSVEIGDPSSVLAIVVVNQGSSTLHMSVRYKAEDWVFLAMTTRLSPMETQLRLEKILSSTYQINQRLKHSVVV